MVHWRLRIIGWPVTEFEIRYRASGHLFLLLGICRLLETMIRRLKLTHLVERKHAYTVSLRQAAMAKPSPQLPHDTPSLPRTKRTRRLRRIDVYLPSKINMSENESLTICWLCWNYWDSTCSSTPTKQHNQGRRITAHPSTAKRHAHRLIRIILLVLEHPRQQILIRNTDMLLS